MNRLHRIPAFLIALSLGLLLAACSPPGEDTADQNAATLEPAEEPTPLPADPMTTERDGDRDSELSGTSWELVNIQSMDDNSWAPDDPTRYTLEFVDDGTAVMQLDCNRGRGTWTSESASQLTFGPVASTNALCQDDGLSERYASQFEWVRSYVMRDGNLYLATMADGAIIEFRPAQ